MPRRSRRSVRHQYLVHAPPARVFRALTDPGEIVRWLADVAEIEPRTGGSYLVGWNDGPQHRGEILEFRRGRKVAFAWSWEGVALKGTRLTFSIAPRGKGTLLTVEHSGFPKEAKWVELYAGAEWGWTYFAMNLKSVLESGHDLRSPLDG